jgi:DNA-binding NtrC family response regulator
MLGSSNIQRFSKTGKAPAPGEASSAGQDEASASAPLLRKVLVVDDEIDLADMAAALLSAHGLEVAVAYSAHDAIRLLGSDEGIDAVFSDIVMPGMTGLQLADVVGEMYPKVKVVLASGYALPSLLAGHERRYLYATKPYRIDTILRLLRS